jgi:molybdenum cofactor guanylyltransferase
VVLPVAHGHRQPLAAAYRTALLPVVERLIAADRLKPAFLFERATVRELGEDELLRDRELAAADPELLSLLNVNDPAGYERARERPVPVVTVRHSGGAGPLPVRATTLAAAATAAGVDLDAAVVAELNGDPIGADPAYPLAAGDAVAFVPAEARAGTTA